jgi:hypothetical protein
MFTDVDADIYVLVDGDATYDAPSAPAMIEKLVRDRLDMVCGVRADREGGAYRLGHRTGNRLLTWFVGHVFGQSFSDMLSGYRVFTRRFVKSFPVLSGGFEIEAELTVHALELELPVGELRTPYYPRPPGSTSKLSTWKDGMRIVRTVFKIYWSERPLPFFGSIGIAIGLVALGLALPVANAFFREGIVLGLPMAILSAGLMVIAVLSLACGLVLDTVTRGRRELKLLAYLAQRAPAEERRRG